MTREELRKFVEDIRWHDAMKPRDERSPDPSVVALAEAWLRLDTAVAEHHRQRADDRCWLDDCQLYVAAGLPSGDNTVGNKFEMLKNCTRFIDNRCKSGGPWKSYAELEAEIVALREERKAKLGGTPLHVLWTKAVGTPGYVKAEWRELEGLLTNLIREVASLRTKGGP